MDVTPTLRLPPSNGKHGCNCQNPVVWTSCDQQKTETISQCYAAETTKISTCGEHVEQQVN